MLVIVSFVYRSVVDEVVPSLIGSVYGFCGTFPLLQISDSYNPSGSNSHTGGDRRRGLHIRLGVDYPLQEVVVDVGVLQV